GAEIVERDRPRDQRRAAQRVVAVERGRDDVRDREERDHDRDQGDQMAPPRVAEAAAPLAAPRDRDRDGELGFALGSAHARFSSAFVREKEIAEMVATMKKMKMPIAVARP